MNNLNKGSFIKMVLAISGIMLAGLSLIAATYREQESSSSLFASTLSSTSVFGDALSVLDNIQQLEVGIAASQAASGSEPGWNRTSDFMAGTVTVSIILPDCNGAVQTCTQGGWSTNDVSHVLAETQRALGWWEQKASEEGVGEHLSFQLTANSPLIVPTGYEPIEIPGGGDSLCGNEGVWIDNVMANLGYNVYSGSNTYFMEVRQYNNDLREQYNTDWAFTMFVVDSSNNPGGNFAGTTCGGAVEEFSVAAWAYIAGPFFVANTVNNGYGYEFIDGVVAHEIGHIFGAPDEVPSNTCMAPPDAPTCNTPFGYLGFENQNCGAREPSFSCTIDVDDSLMVVPEDQLTGDILNVIHEYTVGHIGWHDSDSDGILIPWIRYLHMS